MTIEILSVIKNEDGSYTFTIPEYVKDINGNDVIIPRYECRSREDIEIDINGHTSRIQGFQQAITDLNVFLDAIKSLDD